MNFELINVNHAVVVGAGHGIGLSLVKKILEFNSSACVFATFNSPEKNKQLLELQIQYRERLQIFEVDPTSEEELSMFKKSVRKTTSQIELLINSVGFLHNDEISPEKRLRDVNLSSLQKYFTVNTFPHLLLAKEFHSLFKHSTPSSFVALSAKVGSIEDNGLGGWYGYRSSKAALNMLVKGIALEFSRRGCRSLVLAIHPGTTITELSKPFIPKTKYKLHSTDETALNILRIIDKKALDRTGSFYSWNGEEIPW